MRPPGIDGICPQRSSLPQDRNRWFPKVGLPAHHWCLSMIFLLRRCLSDFSGLRSSTSFLWVQWQNQEQFDGLSWHTSLLDMSLFDHAFVFATGNISLNMVGWFHFSIGKLYNHDTMLLQRYETTPWHCQTTSPELGCYAFFSRFGEWLLQPCTPPQAEA